MLDNPIFCVTGAGSGIGQAVALRLAATGATVILVGKSFDTLQKTAALIKQLRYPESILYLLDYLQATEEDCVELAVTIGERFGRLTGLIHCAGILGTVTPIIHYPQKTVSELFKILIQTPFALTKACLPLLKETQPRSHLLFTRHRSAEGKAYWAGYGAAHAAIGAFVGSLQEEYEQAPTLHITAIDPVKIRTRLRALAYPGESPGALPSPAQVAEFYYQTLLVPPPPKTALLTFKAPTMLPIRFISS